MQRIRLLFGISIFWLALSMLSDGLNTLVLPVYVLTTADTARQGTLLGLLTAVGLLLGMLVQPVFGMLSDRLRPRWGRRGMLMLGVLLTLAALALMGIAQGMVLIAIGYILVQITASGTQAVQQGFIPDRVAVPLRGTAAGVKGFMDLAGAVLGFAILGDLLNDQRPERALLAIAGVLLITALLTYTLVQEDQAPLQAASARLRLSEVFQIDTRQHASFVRLIIARFFFLFGTYAVGRFLLYFIADRLNLNPGSAAETTGGLLAVLALLTALGSPLAGWASDHVGRIPLMLVGSVLSTLGIALMIFATSTMLVLIFGGLMALGSAAFASANWALTADLSPPDEAARFLGLANIGNAGAAAAVGLLGPMIDWANASAPGMGYSVLFGWAALMCAASIVALKSVNIGSGV